MNNLLSRIIKAGVLVGTLDILTAFVHYYLKTGNNPLGVLQYVASGMFGKEAFVPRYTMFGAGLFLHYIIAFAFTIFFFWLFPKLNFVSKHKVLTGVLYGLFIWSVMNLIIVPLSKIPARPFNVTNALINVAILVVCIGIPLSFMANTFYAKANKQNP